MRITLRSGPYHGLELDYFEALAAQTIIRVPERLTFREAQERNPRTGQYRYPMRIPSGTRWMWWAGWEDDPLVDPRAIYCSRIFLLGYRRAEEEARRYCRLAVERFAEQHGLEIDDATQREETDPPEDDYLKDRGQGRVTVRAIGHNPYTPRPL